MHSVILSPVRPEFISTTIRPTIALLYARRTTKAWWSLVARTRCRPTCGLLAATTGASRTASTLSSRRTLSFNSHARLAQPTRSPSTVVSVSTLPWMTRCTSAISWPFTLRSRARPCSTTLIALASSRPAASPGRPLEAPSRRLSSQSSNRSRWPFSQENQWS